MGQETKGARRTQGRPGWAGLWVPAIAVAGLAGGAAHMALAEPPAKKPIAVAPTSPPLFRSAQSPVDAIQIEAREIREAGTGLQPEPPRFPDRRVPDIRDLPKVPNSKDGNPTAPPQPNEPPPAAVDPTRERRLPLLGTPKLGSPPQPDKATLERFGKFVGDIVDPDNTLNLVLQQPRILKLKAVPLRAQIADPKIADFGFLTDTDLSVQGLAVGQTVLNLWFRDPADARKEIILSYLVQVLPDTQAKTRLENVYKALEEEINRAFPDSHICLALVGDKLAVSGQAKDIAEATAILRIVRANAPANEQPAAQIPVSNVNLNVNAEIDPETAASPLLREFLLAGGPNVINLIRIPGEQQVMLKVIVAEVDRTAARSIGLNFSIENNAGISVFSQLTGSLLGAGPDINNLPVFLDNGQVAIAINALRTLQFARTYAEPSLTALNGRPAAFQAGGQFPVPVVTGFTNAGLQGVQFVPFGVQLRFTPYITDKDRIRLTISAEVSAQNGQSNVAGSVIPNLTTRNFQTTVELREGQTLAVAGLIQNDFRGNANRVPWFGDLPFVGRVFAADRLTSAEQELVILITPKLVHPMEQHEVPPLPGSDIFEPGDIEFYLRGILESRRTQDYRAGARTDIDRMRAYRSCENVFIVGPHGSCAPVGPGAGLPVPPAAPAQGGTAVLPPPTPLNPK